MNNEAGEPPGYGEKSCPLIHDYTGHVAGGKPETAVVVKAEKLIKSNFLITDSAMVYMGKRRSFLNQLKCYYSGENIYTLLGIFAMKAHAYHKTYTPLMLQKGYYTSFLHFISEFELKLFPDLKARAQNELTNRVQGDKETVRAYWTEFEDLVNVTKRDQDTLIIQFTNGLKDKSIARGVNERYYAPGERTLYEVATHACQTEEQCVAQAGAVSAATHGRPMNTSCYHIGSLKL